jgi:hypothetical protein
MTETCTLAYIDGQSAANIGDHMRALRHKYSQKTMGGAAEDIYSDTSIHPSGPHEVPVENFLNAQCEAVCVLHLEASC